MGFLICVKVLFLSQSDILLDVFFFFFSFFEEIHSHFFFCFRAENDFSFITLPEGRPNSGLKFHTY